MFDGTVGDDLHHACVDGTPLEVELCLRRGENPNKHNDNGMCPIHLAVLRQRDDVETILDLLLAYGAKVNAKNLLADETPLHLVIKYGRLDRAEPLVLKLLYNKANTELRDKGRLILAVMQGTMDNIQSCIKREPNMNYLNETGSGAIHYAVTHCKLDKTKVISLLVNEGTDVNLTNNKNDTALSLVIKTDSLRHRDVMCVLTSQLLDMGADQTIKDAEGNDAWDLAVAREYKDVQLILRPGYLHSPPPSPTSSQESMPLPENFETLHEAVLRGTVDDVRHKLQEPGTIVNEPDEDGYSAIHLVPMRKKGMKEDIIDALTTAADTLNLQTPQARETVLHIAAEQNDVTTTKKVLQMGIQYGLRNKDGKTAYDIAIDCGHDEIARLIQHRKEIAEKFQKAAKKSRCTIL